ncbi:MAG: ribonuclease Z [Candidatus Pacearchaeota archaeon]|nr:ribonuclease Z [Candidatus Pacearchaeota archaeon]
MSEKIKIIFLGTSDAIPSAKRNHPSFLLVYEGENILVDCGEGTQRQFRKAGLNPCKLTRMLITHWHADHILGIPGLIKTLALSGYNKTLYVYGPRGTRFLMEALLKLFAVQKNFKIEIKEVSGKFFENNDFYLEAESMTHGTSCNAYTFVKKGRIRIDKAKLRKFKIKEGPHLKSLKEGKNIEYNGKTYSAKNLVFKTEDKKISFALDTSVNLKLNKFVRNSDAFVCEASYLDELKELAKKHQHLTSRQAAEISKKAKVKKLFLVHISQRYEKNSERILSEAKKVFKNSVIPQDLDIVEI